MRTFTITTTVTPTLALIAWLLVPQTAHCFYNSSTGRWINRDPLQERGGANIYSFIGNSPMNAVDYNGWLRIKRLGGEFNRCRDISVTYRFDLDKEPKADGFLVQHLTIEWYGLSCDGKKSDTKRVELWELMGMVTKGHQHVLYWDVNTFWYPEKKGFIKLQRELRSFPVDAVKDSPPTSWSTTPLPGWSTAPGTTEWPSWWSTGWDVSEGAAENSWSLTFNCCCPGRKAKFHDTAPGEDLDYDDTR
jgi:hypothetical protein